MAMVRAVFTSNLWFVSWFLFHFSNMFWNLSRHALYASVRHSVVNSNEPPFRAMPRIFDFYFPGNILPVQSCASQPGTTHHRTANIKNCDHRLFTGPRAKTIFTQNLKVMSFQLVSSLATTTKDLHGLCWACWACVLAKGQSLRNMSWTMICHSLLQLSLTVCKYEQVGVWNASLSTYWERYFMV